MFLRPTMLRSPEDGGSGGGEDPPTPRPTPAPTAAPAAVGAAAPARSDTIADVRAEAAQYRINARQHKEEADGLRTQLESLRTQHESDKVKVAEPLQAKILKIQQRVIESTLTASLIAAGLVDPDLVALSRTMPDAPKLALDDDDNVTGVADMVAKFKAWKPDYFKVAGAQEPTPKKKPTTTGDGGEPPPTGGAPKTNIRDMNKDEYAAFKKAELGKVKQAGWRN